METSKVQNKVQNKISIGRNIDLSKGSKPLEDVVKRVGYTRIVRGVRWTDPSYSYWQNLPNPQSKVYRE